MSLLRAEEYRALSTVSISGTIIDLGGVSRSAYWDLLKGKHSFTSVNIDASAAPDIFADLEEPLPIADGAYDNAILINVLEHIFRYRELLTETRRVIRAGGSLVVVVPYLFPYHPSPSDYHRFSRTALERALQEAGFVVDTVTPLGSGVFAARYLLLERLLPAGLQRMLSILGYPLVRAADHGFVLLAHALGKKYAAADYALGFMVTAHAAQSKPALR